VLCHTGRGRGESGREAGGSPWWGESWGGVGAHRRRCQRRECSLDSDVIPVLRHGAAFVWRASCACVLAPAHASCERPSGDSLVRSPGADTQCSAVECSGVRIRPCSLVLSF
jgi:hypothetical protein